MHQTNRFGSPPGREHDRDDLAIGIVAGVVSAGVLLVAFSALALGVEAWWLAFPLGYGGVLPLSVGVARWRAGGGRSSGVGTAAVSGRATTESTQSRDTEAAALATLRRRYAEGEIDEVEFERRVETLLREEEAGQAGDRSVDASTGDR